MTSWVGPEQLSSALYGCHLVLIPAGVPRKPGMTRDDLFNINAGDQSCLGPTATQRCYTAPLIRRQGQDNRSDVQ